MYNYYVTIIYIFLKKELLRAITDNIFLISLKGMYLLSLVCQLHFAFTYESVYVPKVMEKDLKYNV
jgi:hypothetical protein